MRAAGAADIDLPFAIADGDAPTSLIKASEQFRGQPAVASFSFAGLSMPRNRFSILPASPMLSPRPKRQNSVPMQLLQVR